MTFAPLGRRGFVLPFVVLAIAASSLLALGFAAEAWQALRAVRGAQAGADAGHVADAALSLTLEAWAHDSVWTMPPGIPRRYTRVVAGVPVTVEWQRHHPLAAALRAIRDDPGGRPLDAVARDHLRAVWLQPPPLPVLAAITSNGSLTGAEGSLVSGSDLVLPGSPCGPTRDTASVAPVVGAGVRESTAGAWPGAPTALPPPLTLQADLAGALSRMAPHVPIVVWDSTPRSLPDASAWRAVRIRAARAVIRGPVSWRGLLVVHGDLTVVGGLEVTGMLVVEGRLDASVGPLSVQGAVIVADTSAKGVMLGGRGRVFYDRCTVQMALATAAQPSFAPLATWQRLPR